MGWFLFLLAMAVLIAAPFALEARRARPSKADEDAAEGTYAQLASGKTYYEWHGPIDGDVLVCVHGLSTPSFIWQGLMRNLTMMGYRVLTYDLYGRGLSADIGGPQTREFFLRQLRELLADQKIEDFTLMGFSMGGQIAMAMTAEEPERVERLILLAPAGFGYDPGPVGAFLRDNGRLGDWLNLVIGRRVMRRALAPLAAIQTAVPDLAAKQMRQIERRNFVRRTLSSQRHMLADSAAADMAEIKSIFVPTLAIWGEKDTVIPSTSIGKLAKANRHTQHVTIPGASHWLPATHPHEVSAAITEFRRDT